MAFERRISTKFDASTAGHNRGTRRVQDQLRRLDRTSENRLGRMDRRFERSGRAFQSFARTVQAAGVALAFAAMAKAASDLVRNGDQLRRLEGRFTALTGSAQRGEGAMRNVLEVAANTGASIDDVGSAVARFTIAAQELGASDEQVARLTETIIKLGTIGGSTTQEIASASVQLGQGLASGVLQGEELKSVLENMPLVARQIAQELGVSVGQLRDMGAAGELTADRVFTALLNGAEDVDEQFSKLPGSVERSAAKMANSWTKFTAKIDESIGLSQTLAAVIEQVADGLDRMAGSQLSAFEEANRLVFQRAAILNQIRNDTTSIGLREAEAALADAVRLRQAAARATEFDPGEDPRGRSQIPAPVVRPDRAPQTSPLPPELPIDFLPGDDLDPPTPTRRSRSGGGGGGRVGVSALEQVERVATDAIEAVTERIRALENEASVVDRLAALRARLTEAELSETEITAALEREQTRLNAAFEASTVVRELEARAAREGITLTAEQKAQVAALAAEEERLTLAIHDKAAAMDAAAQAAEEARRQDEEAAQAVADLSDRFSGIIQQAESFEDALKKVAIELANLVAQAIAGEGPLAALFGGQRGGGGFLGNLAGSIFGGGGGSSGGGFSSLLSTPTSQLPVLRFHKGGVVGRGGTPAGSMPAELFANAPRLHSGGIIGPNEVPAILERGEIVVPKNIGSARQMSSVTVEGSTIVLQGGQATPEELQRVLDRRDRALIERITRMNEADPSWLHT